MNAKKKREVVDAIASLLALGLGFAGIIGIYCTFVVPQ